MYVTIGFPERKILQMSSPIRRRRVNCSELLNGFQKGLCSGHYIRATTSFVQKVCGGCGCGCVGVGVGAGSATRTRTSACTQGRTHSRAQTTTAHFVSASFFREAVLDTWQALYHPRSWSWPMAVPQRKVPNVG